jgi:hypothetical protein
LEHKDILSRDERTAGGRAALYLDLIALGQDQPADEEAIKALSQMNGRILVFASGEVQLAVRRIEALLNGSVEESDEEAVPKAWDT